MAELHKNLINGEWVGSEGKENINPSNTSEVVGVYAQANAQEAQDAIAAAKAAFPAWSATTAPRTTAHSISPTSAASRT